VSSDDTTVSAADISRNFGDWQSRAMQKPVIITHHGRPRLMLVSVEAFKKAEADPQALSVAADVVTQFQSVLSQIREAFYALNKDFQIIEVNAAAERYFGLTRSAMLGKDFRQLIPHTRDSMAWDIYRRVMQTGEQAEFKINGSIRGRPKLNVKAFPFDGGGVGVMFTSNEIADQESLLRKRGEALFKALKCEPALSVAVLNSRGGIELADDAFCDLTGFRRDQLESLTLAELVGTAQRTLLMKAMNETLRDDVPKALDVALLTKSGDTKSVRLSLGAAAHDVAADEIVVWAVDVDRIAVDRHQG
jgi:prevent-host-death family protein